MEDGYEGFEEFVEKVSEEGLNLLSVFGHMAKSSGLLVTPLLFGKEDNQVGFSIIDNRDNLWLNKYEVMLRKKI